MKLIRFLSIGAALILGFIAGTMSSTFTLEFLDSSAKAALLTHELRRLRSGDVDEYLSTKEVELDGAIYNHVRYRRGIYPYLAWPVSMQYDHEKYMRTVLDYRKEFPSEPLSTRPNITADQKSFWEEHEAQLDSHMAIIRGWYAN